MLPKQSAYLKKCLSGLSPSHFVLNTGSYKFTVMGVAEDLKSNGSSGDSNVTSSKESTLTRTPSAFGLYLKDDLSKAKFSTVIFSMTEKVGALSEALKIFSVSQAFRMGIIIHSSGQWCQSHAHRVAIVEKVSG